MHTLLRRRNGQSMVEFAVLAPVFFMLLLGTIDLGRAIYIYNSISDAAREGARAAIPYDNPLPLQSQVIIALSATALLGIIALGMDAGRLYFQRRDVQNAADAGALAGAEELVSTGAIAGQTTGMRTQANCQASLYALNNLALTPSNPTC